MSTYSNVTEQHLINLRKLAEQQKNQGSLKIKNRTLKQTLDVKLAEYLSPITKKLDEVNKSTQKLGDMIKKPSSKIDLKSLPNILKYSDSMRQMIASLMNSKTSLKIIQDDINRATILGVLNQISENDTMKTKKNIYELTPEIFKALTYPTYTGRTMKNESDFLKIYNIIRDLEYTGIEDRKSNRKTFFTKTLPKLVEEIQNKTFDDITDESDDLRREGKKLLSHQI